MSNVPCQECGTEFEYNDSPTDFRVCFPCVDKVAFTIFSIEYQPTLLDIAEGRHSMVEHIASVRWKKHSEDVGGFGQALVETKRDMARAILRSHPRMVVPAPANVEFVTVNPYEEFLPGPGESLKEWLTRKGWPEHIMPLPMPMISVGAKQILGTMVQPYLECRPFMFLVEPHSAPDFDVLNITQSNISCLIGPDPIGAIMFGLYEDGKPQALPLTFRSMTPAERLTISVRNNSSMAQQFRCCFLCTMRPVRECIRVSASETHLSEHSGDEYCTVCFPRNNRVTRTRTERAF